MKHHCAHHVISPLLTATPPWRKLQFVAIVHINFVILLFVVFIVVVIIVVLITQKDKKY